MPENKNKKRIRQLEEQVSELTRERDELRAALNKKRKES